MEKNVIKIIFFTFLFFSFFSAMESHASASIPDVFIINNKPDYLVNGSYNTTRIVADYYSQGNPDIYDFLMIASDFDVTSKPNYLPLRNHVKGSAIPDQEPPADWNINSKKIIGVISMQNIDGYISNEADPSYNIGWKRIVLHEFFHNWGVYLGLYSTSTYGNINDLGGHWGRNVLLPSILMGGNNLQYWQEDGAGNVIFKGTPISDKTNLKLDPIMMYLAGFVCKNDIQNSKYIVIPTDSENSTKAKIEKYFSIDDVVKKEGERSPNCNNSQKNFRIGIIFLKSPEKELSVANINKIESLKKQLPVWWSEATDNRSALSFDGKAVAKPKTESESEIIIKSGYDINTILQHTKLKKNLKKQTYYFKITESLTKGKKLTLNQKYSINNFIVYGTKSSAKLSSEQRLKIVKKYLIIKKSLPKSIKEWDALLKIKI